MGFLDHLKDMAEEFGEQAKEDEGAESTAGTETSAADDIGDLPDPPAADPLESAPEAVDPVLEPSTSTDTNDPLESAPDRTG